MAVSDWSSTAASNTTVGGISIAEGMSPANVNNAMREMMAQIADWYGYGGVTQTILTSGTAQTYTTPTGCVALMVTCIGGGGGGGGVAGGGSSTTGVSGPGGAGGYCALGITNPAASYTYTVGAGGAGGAAGANNGSAGTATTFSNGGSVNMSAGGGSGGTGDTGVGTTTSTPGGDGGAASGGDINVKGDGGRQALIVSGLPAQGPPGGNTMYGVGGTTENVAGTGEDAAGYGAGGGGTVIQNSASTSSGGDGADGLIIVLEIY